MKTKQSTIAELKLKFPCIFEWGRQLKSYAYYIQEQARKAESLNAPRNTIYFKGDEPVTTDEMGNKELKAELEALL